MTTSATSTATEVRRVTIEDLRLATWGENLDELMWVNAVSESVLNNPDEACRYMSRIFWNARSRHDRDTMGVIERIENLIRRAGK